MFRSMSEWCLFAPQNKPLDYNTLRKAIITFLGKNHITYKKSIKKGVHYSRGKTVTRSTLYKFDKKCITVKEECLNGTKTTIVILDIRLHESANPE